MGTLKIKQMPQMTDTNATKEVLDFLTEFIPYSVILAGFWKLVDAIFKYASDGRDARTKELIHQANEPLKEDISKLTESIYELRDEIKRMK